MRKIKNFKVNLRIKEIGRVVARVTNNTPLPEELANNIVKACRYYSKFIVPCVVYDSFAKDSLALDLHPDETEFSKKDETTKSKDVPKRWVAQTFFILTIGNKLFEEFEKNRESFGQYSSEIVTAIAVDSLEQAKNFIQRLTAKEASEENCDISRSNETPKTFFKQISEQLSPEKIGVFVENEEFIPKYSMSGFFYWLHRKKVKN
jgi:predicted lactoylglutathione lyase